jgi:hypothetical protein
MILHRDVCVSNQWGRPLRHQADHLGGFDYVRVIVSNGVEVIRPRCLACGYVFGQSVARSRFSSAVLADLPLVRDDRSPDYPCERCGELGVERHHWGPYSVFGWPDYETWPTSWLCPPCHREWHRRTGIGVGR